MNTWRYTTSTPTIRYHSSDINTAHDQHRLLGAIFGCYSSEYRPVPETWLAPVVIPMILCHVLDKLSGRSLAWHGTSYLANSTSA